MSCDLGPGHCPSKCLFRCAEKRYEAHEQDEVSKHGGRHGQPLPAPTVILFTPRRHARPSTFGSRNENRNVLLSRQWGGSKRCPYVRNHLGWTQNTPGSERTPPNHRTVRRASLAAIIRRQPAIN